MSEFTHPGSARAYALAATGAILIFMFTGCSDEPTAANAPLVALPLTNLSVRDTTVVATGSSTFRQRLATNSSVNLIGRSGNYTSVALIQFTQSYLPARDTALVYSATLTLRFETWFGDSSGQFSFNIYRVSIPWGETTLTWDTVQAPGFYEQYTVRGSYTGGAGPDTQTVTIPLDTAMVRQWLATPTSATYSNNGIILVPTAGCTMMRGFNEYGYPTTDSTSYFPTVRIIAGSPSGNPVDTASYTIASDTWAGNIDNLATNPQLIYLQSGVSYRSALNFDVSAVPRGAIVNSASLVLTGDPATTRIDRFANDTSFTLAATLSPSDRTSVDVYSVTSVRLPGTLLTYTVDMTRPVQIWNKQSNYGVTLTPNVSYQAASFELLTFFNEKAPPALRPRLKIKYSVLR